MLYYVIIALPSNIKHIILEEIVLDVGMVMWDQDFRVTNDIEASQILKALEESDRDSSRLVKNVREEIMVMEQLGKDIEDKHNRLKERVIFLLERYMAEEVLSEDIKETKTQKKYSLARGDIIVKKPTTKIEKPIGDEELKLIDLYPDYVESKPVLKWKDLKDSMKITEDGRVVNNRTNEVIEGVRVLVDAPPTQIKFRLQEVANG
jgi:hypothetical protein